MAEALRDRARYSIDDGAGMEATRLLATVSLAQQSSSPAPSNARSGGLNQPSLSPSWVLCIKESPADHHPLQQLALYLHVPSLTDPHREALEVKLFEFTPTATPVLGVQSPRFVFHMASNCLTLNVRSAHALLALCFATRDHEPVRGTYYRWRDHEHARFDLTVDIDLSLLHQFAAARD